MDQERIARLEEQGKWIASKVDRIERKLDILSDRLTLWTGKIIGAAAIAGFFSALVLDWFKR